MSREWWLLLILLILNLSIVIIYLVWNLLIRCRENKPAVIMKAAVMLLCPVIGPLFLMLGFLFYKLFMGQAMDLEDVIFNKEKVETFMHPDEDMERNMVSIEEALAVTDKGNLRTLMMNVIRGDYSQSLSGFLMALNSDDSETAHYAASVLQEVLNGFRVNVQRMYKAALEEADKSLDLVRNSILGGLPEDFFSIDLMNAYENLGKILGESVGEDLVNEIFSKFCTGK